MITAIITAIFLLFLGTVAPNDACHHYISLTVENEVHSGDDTAVFKIKFPQEINGIARLYLKTDTENDDMAARTMLENGMGEFQITAIEGTYYVICTNDETGELIQSNEAVVKFTPEASIPEEVTTATKSTITSTEKTITEATTVPPDHSTVDNSIIPWLACIIVAVFLIFALIKIKKHNK